MNVKFLLAIIVVACMSSQSIADHVWVNELHYDNVGTDVGEFIEIGIRTPNGSGDVASDYVVEFYNGSNGAVYETTTTLNLFDFVSEPFAVASPNSPDEVITLYSTAVAPIQNGNDGFAIVNQTTGLLVPDTFYSYEGAFAATDGAAVGLTAVDLSASEPSGQDIGLSLSAVGSGFGQTQFDNTSFVAGVAQTPGGINTGQTFTRAAAVPEPSSLAVLGLIGFVGMARRRRN